MASPTVFRVPVANLPDLEATFARLQKRATKLGSGAITLQVHPRVEMVEITRYVAPEHGDQLGRPRKVQVPHRRVRVTGSRPVVANDKGETWEFVATLQHEAEGTIVRQVPTADLDEGALKGYRDATAACDHCGFDRRRKDTFVVRDPDGALKQVGRNCLRDYFGHDDPMDVAKLAELLASGLEACAGAAEDEGLGGWGSRGELTFGSASFLETALGAIREHGWLSRTKARGTGREATADIAWGHLVEVSMGVRKHRYEIDPADGDEAEAARILAEADRRLEAAADQDRLGDYEHNLRTTLASGTVTSRTAGLVGSAVGYVQRAENRERETVKLTDLLAGSQHQGEIGDRIDRVVEIDGRHYFEGDFGPTTLVRYHDEAGNAYLWWASGMRDEIEIGRTYWATATIKKHEEDRRHGWPVTVVKLVAFGEDHEALGRATVRPCPQCGVDAGVWCRTPKGGRRTSIHKRRPQEAA